MFQQLIDYFADRSVLLLGFGREGHSTYRFIRQHFPHKPIGIADINGAAVEDEFVRVFSGDGYMNAIARYDLIMQSPGISMRGVNIPANAEISGQTDLFLRFVACETVGITGTKGKTTTSSLIYEILNAAQKPACLIGNIGVPVFDALAELEGKTAVIEMSSHQLEFAKASPHIAVLTNIYEEHLDHYNGFAAYVNAKLNIVKYQTEEDFFIYNADQDTGEFIDFITVRSKTVPVSAQDGEQDGFLNSLTRLNERLPGTHNRQDIFYAAAAAKCLGIDEDAVFRGIKNFGGIEHRMEPVGVFRGIKFYNDSIATIPASVMLNVKALEKVNSLIIGGMDRGIDYSGFLKDLEVCGVKNLICLPDTGHTIGKELIRKGSKMTIVFADNMEQAVAFAFELTDEETICLLSPAASSYNTYKDFVERGEHFKKLVKEMSGKIGI